MKSVPRLHFLIAILCLGIGSLQAEKMFEGDSLGSLKLGQSAEAVTKALGKPQSKARDIEWEAIGEFVQEWHFPKQGLTLTMTSAKKGGAKTILSITAAVPCDLATSRGIKIGSTEAAVTKAYRDVQNKEEGTAGELFVAGSIYGGAMFHLRTARSSRSSSALRRSEGSFRYRALYSGGLRPPIIPDSSDNSGSQRPPLQRLCAVLAKHYCFVVERRECHSSTMND